MRRRILSALLRSRLAVAPAVALLGARQCGKTTLARSLPCDYFDAEQAGDRVRLDLQWPALVERRKLVVIDEAQTWPDLFPRLRSAIDADRKRTGRFLLLGSVSPTLMREVSESLAGRLALVELSPFLLSELGANALPRLWLMGGFPDGGVLGGNPFPSWQRDYLALITQRDLPNWGLPARPALVERLLGMLAVVHGQPWNASRLGQSLGLSYHTVNHYLEYLEGAFLVRRLAPWSANLGKRLVKAPRLYLRDTGLLHALLGVGSRDGLLRHPSAGASWEGFVIEQIAAHLSARGVDFRASFLRTSDGYEVDLLLELHGTRVALEVKLSSEATLEDLGRLDRAADLAFAPHRYVVCGTTAPLVAGTRGILNLPLVLERLATIARQPTRAKK